MPFDHNKNNKNNFPYLFDFLPSEIRAKIVAFLNEPDLWRFRQVSSLAYAHTSFELLVRRSPLLWHFALGPNSFIRKEVPRLLKSALFVAERRQILQHVESMMRAPIPPSFEGPVFAYLSVEKYLLQALISQLSDSSMPTASETSAREYLAQWAKKVTTLSKELSDTWRFGWAMQVAQAVGPLQIDPKNAALYWAPLFKSQRHYLNDNEAFRAWLFLADYLPFVTAKSLAGPFILNHQAAIEAFNQANCLKSLKLTVTRSFLCRMVPNAEKIIYRNRVADHEENDQSQKEALIHTVREAIRARNLLQVLRLIYKEQVDLNTQNQRGFTFLMLTAVKPELYQIGVALIAAGTSLDLKNQNGDTALSIAAINNNEKLLKALIAVGAKLDSQNESKQTALMGAIIVDNQEAAFALIKAGANLNIQDEEGNTALHLAAIHNRYSILFALLAAGCDITIKNGEGNTVYERLFANNTIFNVRNARAFIHRIMQIENESSAEKMVEYFRKAPHPALAERMVRIFLKRAGYFNQVTLSAPFLTESFLQHYPVPGLAHFSLFTYFSPYIELKVAKAMAKMFLPTASLNREGATKALEEATTQQDLIAILREARLEACFSDSVEQSTASVNADQMNAPNPSDETPLFLAADRGDLMQVCTLIKQGINLDTLSKISFETPLMRAISKEHLNCVLALLVAGAETQVEDNTGKTANTKLDQMPGEIKTTLRSRVQALIAEGLHQSSQTISFSGRFPLIPLSVNESESAGPPYKKVAVSPFFRR